MEPEKKTKKRTAEHENKIPPYFKIKDGTEDEENFNPMISLASPTAIRREMEGVILERQGTIRGRKL